MAHYQRRLVERDFFLNTRLDDFLYLRDDFGVERRRRREPPLPDFLICFSLCSLRYALIPSSNSDMIGGSGILGESNHNPNEFLERRLRISNNPGYLENISRALLVSSSTSPILSILIFIYIYLLF